MKRFVWLVFFVVLVGACSGARKKNDPEPTAPGAPEIQSGAQQWTGGALLLPLETPVVVEARLDRLLDAVSRLKDWVLAEPAMLGEDGEETARAIELAWAGVATYLGTDPLTSQAWTSRGIDVSRPIFVGAYPVGETERQFVRAVDAQIRTELGAPPGAPVAKQLQTLVATAGELPEGANARILRAVEGRRPLGGLRIVVPVTTSIDFLATVASFAEGMGFQRFPPEIAADLKITPLERAYWSETSVPAMAVRVEGSHAVVDVLFPAFFGGALHNRAPDEQVRAIYEDLKLVLADVPSGRPRAPRAPDDPAFAVTFDQPRTADLVRLRGYRQALQSLQTARADKRDALLLEGLVAASAEGDAWAVGAEDLTGLSYALRLGGPESRELGRVVMTLFGRTDLPALPPVPRHPSLGIQEHSAGLAVTFDPMYSEAWKTWFVGPTTRALSALEPEMIATPRIGLPGFRVLALLFASVGDRGALTELSRTFAEGVAELYGVRHVEMVALTADVADFRQHPRLLLAAVFDPDDDLAVRSQAVLNYTVAASIQAFGAPQPPEGGPPNEEIPRSPAPAANATHAVVADGLPTLLYRLSEDSKTPFMLIGAGVTPEELEAEMEAMRTRQSEPHVLSGRIEPVALLNWLRLDDADVLEPLDANILAQRLGPVVIQLAPQESRGTRTVTLEVSLGRPPKL